MTLIYLLQVTVIFIISGTVVSALYIWESPVFVNRDDICVMIRQGLCDILDVGR